MEQISTLPVIIEQLLDGLPPLDDTVMASFRENVELAFAGGMAQETLRALKSDGLRFRRWCQARAANWLPADPSVVKDFLQEMSTTGKRPRRGGKATGYAPATIDRFTASIKTWHVLAELPPPTTSPKVKLTRKAHRREVGSVQRQATALTIDKLQRILTDIDVEIAELSARIGNLSPKDRLKRLAALRDRALLLTGYCTLARGGELLALRWDDLHLDDHGAAVGTIRRSKTDQEGEGADQHLWPSVFGALSDWQAAHDAELARCRDEEAARIEAIRRRRSPPRVWRTPRKKTPAPPVKLAWETSPYIFRGLKPARVGPRPAKGKVDTRVWHGWSPRLSLRAFDVIIAARAKVAGLPAGRYSSHSLRIGAAQDLLAAGSSLAGIMQAGRWKSPQMVLRYVRKLMAGQSAMADWGRELEGLFGPGQRESVSTDR